MVVHRNHTESGGKWYHMSSDGLERMVHLGIADTASATAFGICRAAARGVRDKLLYGVPIDFPVLGLQVIGDSVMGRPYGMFRDYLQQRLGITAESAWWRKAGVDILANALFYDTIYAAALAWRGAEPRQIAVACTISLGVSAVIGRPYGIFLEKMRERFGVQRAPHAMTQGVLERYHEQRRPQNPQTI